MTMSEVDSVLTMVDHGQNMVISVNRSRILENHIDIIYVSSCVYFALHKQFSLKFNIIIF